LDQLWSLMSAFSRPYLLLPIDRLAVLLPLPSSAHGSVQKSCTCWWLSGFDTCNFCLHRGCSCYSYWAPCYTLKNASIRIDLLGLIICEGALLSLSNS
jgi:hypothetical protein